LRQWVLNFRNSGGPAHGMQMTQLVFTLESGTTCTPVVQTALPSLLEALPTAGSATTFPVLINFGTCPVTNRYTVTIGYSANGGAYASQTAIAHQFQ
jgi:hypothetical protein